MENLIIVGTGCAGLTAAIYAGRANLNPLVLEGSEPGGQLTTTTAVENFPGFPDGIQGPDLIMAMKKQAEKFGARFQFASATGFEPGNGSHRLQIDNEWVESKAVIIASGASARYLGLAGEKELIGHGLTSCATCDGAFYRDVPVCVVGGGDTACEEAIFLTKFASKVYLIHRRDQLRASPIMAERALSHEKIEPIWDTVLTGYVTDAEGHVNGVNLRNVNTDQAHELAVRCVFMAIGHTPNTKAFTDHLEVHEGGYLVQKNGTATSVAGIFAAGDVADLVYKQAVTAAGQGCAAALDAERYLAELEE